MIKKILLTILLTLTLITGISAASLKLESSTTNPSIIKPGNEVDIILKVQNILSSNEDPKYSYTLKLEPKTQLTKDNIIITDNEEKLGILGSNQLWDAKFKVKILEGAPATNYEFDVTILKYLDSTLISQTTASISIDVTAETFFILDSQDKTIISGETKTFNAQIKNIGASTAGNIKLEFQNTNEIQILGTNSFYFQKINYNSEESFNITLHANNNLPSKIYTIPATITYSDGTKTITQNIEAGIIVGGKIDLRAAAIQTSPKEIRPGDNYVLIYLNLENAGEEDAKAVESQLISENFKASYSDANKIYSGRINSNSQTNINFYIDIPKETIQKLHTMQLKLNYLNLLGEEFNKTLEIPIVIKEKPILEITNVKATGKAGSQTQIEIQIQNQGTEDADEVDIRLIKDSSLPLTIKERSAYIGTIKANQTKTAIFTIDIEKEADITIYNIGAFIRARGDSEIGDNNIYTYNKDINLEVTGKSINKLALFGIIIVILGLIITFAKKTRKNKK